MMKKKSVYGGLLQIGVRFGVKQKNNSPARIASHKKYTTIKKRERT